MFLHLVTLSCVHFVAVAFCRRVLIQAPSAALGAAITVCTVRRSSTCSHQAAKLADEVTVNAKVGEENHPHVSNLMQKKKN